jgi:hypothetical protein
MITNTTTGNTNPVDSTLEIKKIAELLCTISYFKDIKNKDEFVGKLWRIYGKEFDIVKELMKMELWLDLNPKRRKKCYTKFIFNWLGRKTHYRTSGGGYNDGKQQYNQRKTVVE